MPKTPIIKGKIIILDDDIWPTGRITERILPEFKKRGLDKHLIHYNTFNKLRQDLLEGRLSRSNLFVLDSSLEKEPDGKLLGFQNTVPSLISHGIKVRNMMPGSGWKEGVKNNLWFEEYAERRGRSIRLNQMTLFASGLSGDPEKVVNGILTYHEELFPGTIQKESESTPCTEGALKYWKQRQANDSSRRL